MAQSDSLRTCHSLLGKLRDPRNGAAWAEFHDRYRPLIWRWCGRWDMPSEDREDVCSTVMEKLVGAMQRGLYDPARGSFRVWLRSVVTNTVRDLGERLAVRPGAKGVGGSGMLAVLEQVQTPESIDSLTDELERPLTDNMQRVRSALGRVRDRLEPHNWQAFWLTTVEEQPAAEVAAKLGMKASAVYVVKSRGLTMLREEMARPEQTY